MQSMFSIFLPRVEALPKNQGLAWYGLGTRVAWPLHIMNPANQIQRDFLLDVQHHPTGEHELRRPVNCRFVAETGLSTSFLLLVESNWRLMNLQPLPRAPASHPLPPCSRLHYSGVESAETSSSLIAGHPCTTLYPAGSIAPCPVYRRTIASELSSPTLNTCNLKSLHAAATPCSI